MSSDTSLLSYVKTDAPLLLLKCTCQERFFTDRLLSGPNHACVCMIDGFTMYIEENSFVFVAFRCLWLSIMIPVIVLAKSMTLMMTFKGTCFCYFSLCFFYRMSSYKMYNDKIIKWWQVEYEKELPLCFWNICKRALQQFSFRLQYHCKNRWQSQTITLMMLPQLGFRDY